MQKQINKQAPATAAKKVVKSPAKKASAPRTVRKAAVKATPVIAFVHDQGRPSAGRALFAYTDAWLELSGLKAGGAIQRATLAKIAGDTAVAYHIRTGNLESTVDGLKVTERGAASFSSRDIDAQIQAAYVALMTTGKADGCLGIKNEKTAIKAI